MIAVPVVGRNRHEWEKNLARAKRFADVIEFRLDYFSDFDFSRMHIPGKITIATCRSRAEGGRFCGTPHEQRELLMNAAPFATYVDVELSSLRTCRVETSHGLFLSSHSTRPLSLRDFCRIYRRMKRYKPAVMKIISTAQRVDDVLPALSFVQRYSRTQKLVCFCMGSAGVLSRILSVKLGAYFTFAALPGGVTAPGQLDVFTMKKFLEVLS